MDVELDGLGDDVRVDGQQDDERVALVGEEHVDGIQDGQHLQGGDLENSLGYFLTPTPFTYTR